MVNFKNGLLQFERTSVFCVLKGWKTPDQVARETLENYRGQNSNPHINSSYTRFAASVLNTGNETEVAEAYKQASREFSDGTLPNP